MKKNIEILVLAAGTSSRLGKPKQLIKFKNQSLIQIAVNKALELSEKVTVVLGYKAEEIIEEIIDLPIAICVNDTYDKGIGNTISFGISEIKNSENVLIMLCDQPFIPLSHYINLIDNLEENSLVASKYGSSPTVPAIFSKKFYPSLINLKGDKGAKSILIRENAPTVNLEKENAVDIDTKEDIKTYLNL